MQAEDSPEKILFIIMKKPTKHNSATLKHCLGKKSKGCAVHAMVWFLPGAACTDGYGEELGVRISAWMEMWGPRVPAIAWREVLGRLWLLRQYGYCSWGASAACKAVWVLWCQLRMVSCNKRASQVHSGVLGQCVGGADSRVLGHSSWVSSSAKVGSSSLQRHQAWIRGFTSSNS